MRKYDLPYPFRHYAGICFARNKYHPGWTEFFTHDLIIILLALKPVLAVLKWQLFRHIVLLANTDISSFPSNHI